ncbi:MAG: ComEC/Rec2 family competence protein, partial [Bacteroidota bacterium]
MRKRGVLRDRLWSRLTLWSSIVLIGMLWAPALQEYRSLWSDVAELKQLEIAGIVERPLKFTPKGATTHMMVYAYRRQDDAWRNGRERMKVFLRDTSLQVSIGDTLYLRGNAKRLETDNDSYRAYLQKQGMHFILFAYDLKQGGQGQSWELKIRRMQGRLSELWEEFCEKQEYASLAQAMFLGKKDNMSADLRERFATAGFSHLLAISGLHVGILFVLLSLVVRPLQAHLSGRILATVLQLSALAGFCLLSGAAASVIRASSMFAVYLIVKLCYKRAHPLNIWAFCGLLQLLWEPGDMMNIGFQLSYLAVGVLIVFLPLYVEWVKTPWPWLNRIYDLVGVNILATAATAPLIWHYFGTFPTYFLPANLLVAPVIFVLVLVGFLTVILSMFSPSLAAYPAWLCEKGLMWLDLVATEVQTWPFAKLEGSPSPTSHHSNLLGELVFAFLLIILPKILRLFHRRMITQNGRQGI